VTGASHNLEGAREGKRTLLRLFPQPGEHVELRGLYLDERFAPPQRSTRTFVYTNFISSLDGRVALPDPRTLRHSVPRAIANPRDWRLFQELAACADALVVSGQYVRGRRGVVTSQSFPVSTTPDYADLHEWRAARGLAPQPAIVIVTASVELPPLDALAASGRSVFVATGSAANVRNLASVEAQGARMLFAGRGARVEGGRLVEALALEGHRNIAMISGGHVLATLVADGVLDRLYLTLACGLLGGLSFDTLLTGPTLAPAARFALAALHYEAGAGADGASGGSDADFEQLFAVFDRSN
jgi:riboflavin biosynthesis pyrimidine reductase